MTKEKVKVITLKVTEKEKKSLVRAAKKRHKGNLSEFIRESAFGQVESMKIQETNRRKDARNKAKPQG